MTTSLSVRHTHVHTLQNRDSTVTLALFKAKPRFGPNHHYDLRTGTTIPLVAMETSDDKILSVKYSRQSNAADAAKPSNSSSKTPNGDSKFFLVQL